MSGIQRSSNQQPPLVVGLGTSSIGEIAQKGIARLAMRFQQEFTPKQNPDEIINQAFSLRDVTITLISIAEKSPERLATTLGLISALADVGIIYDMNSAISEISRIAKLLPSEIPLGEGEYSSSEKGQGHLPSPRGMSVADVHPQANATPEPKQAEAPAPVATEAKENAPEVQAPVESVQHTPKKRQSVMDNAQSNFVQGMSPDLPEKPGQWIAESDKPAVPLAESIQHDSITCLHCGKNFTMLKRHIERSHRQRPEAYRMYWGLPENYPMACEVYTEMKKVEALRSGLGTHRKHESSEA